MIHLITAELFVAVFCTVAFLLLYGPPSRYRDRQMAWHVALFSLAMGVEQASLLLLMFGATAPLWAYAIVFGMADAVVVWRLMLLVRYRAKEKVINEDQPGG